MFCGLLFFFQAEDGIRDLVRSRGLGDVYKRQVIIKARDEKIFSYLPNTFSRELSVFRHILDYSNGSAAGCADCGC